MEAFISQLLSVFLEGGCQGNKDNYAPLADIGQRDPDGRPHIKLICNKARSFPGGDYYGYYD